MRLSSMVYHKTENGWHKDIVRFRTRGSSPDTISRALGRAAARQFGTEFVHAEDEIYHGTEPIGHAIPQYVADGARDFYIYDF